MMVTVVICLTIILRLVWGFVESRLDADEGRIRELCEARAIESIGCKIDFDKAFREAN